MTIPEVKHKVPNLYKKVTFNIPIARLDDILDYMENEYALYPIMKDCFGIGKRGSTKECETCEDSDDCMEEAEARAERSYMG